MCFIILPWEWNASSFWISLSSIWLAMVQSVDINNLPDTIGYKSIIPSLHWTLLAHQWSITSKYRWLKNRLNVSLYLLSLKSFCNKIYVRNYMTVHINDANPSYVVVCRKWYATKTSALVKQNTSLAVVTISLPGHISLMVFQSYFQFIRHLLLIQLHCRSPYRYICWTFHDSTTVVPCATLCSDNLTVIWMRTNWNLNWIWIMVEKALVEWSCMWTHVKCRGNMIILLLRMSSWCWHSKRYHRHINCPINLYSLQTVVYTLLRTMCSVMISTVCLCIGYIRTLSSDHDDQYKYKSGPLCTERADVLSPNLVKSRHLEFGCYDDRVALKFDRHLGCRCACYIVERLEKS